MWIINIGSGSKKYALYEGEVQVLFAHAEKNTDGEGAYIVTVVHRGVEETSIIQSAEYDNLFEQLLARTASIASRVAVRVVAGGAYFAEHRVVDAECRSLIEAEAIENPLHLAPLLKEMGRIEQVIPSAQFLMVSDSAFHNTIPDVARMYAIPKALREKLGAFKWGYHGISVSSVARTLASVGVMPERVIVCHLGSGASITALKNGKSVETSMGYTPLSGVLMGTRAGDIDAGILLRMMESGMSAGEIEHVLYEECGLKALGGTEDIRELLTREAIGDADATLALTQFVYRIQKEISAQTAALGGIDALVFTATIGERSSIIRERICAGLAHLGITIDKQKNNTASEKTQTTISSNNHHPVTLITPAQEITEMHRIAVSL